MPKERLLVISSDNAAYQKINKALKKRFDEIVHAKTPIETIAQMEKTAFEGIFIDIDDQKVKNSRLIERLHSKNDSTFVIPIIPRTKIGLIPKIIKRPFYNYLIKPFHPLEVNMVLGCASRLLTLNKEIKALKFHIKELEDAVSNIEQKAASADNIGSIYKHPLAQRQPLSLEAFVEERLNKFIKKLDVAEGANFYDMVITEIEKPLLSMALKETGGNQLRAANLLGINRNTLRKKICDLNLSTYLKEM